MPRPNKKTADAIESPPKPLTPAELKVHYAALFKRVRSKLTLDVMMVTPEQAAQWLARNKGNRPLGAPTIERYSAYILGAEWCVNGEPVILDDDENLLDGQHRLQAVVGTGVAVPMLVVYGVPADVFPTLNTGKTRCLADVLAITGNQNQRTLAGAIRMVWHHRNNTLASVRHGGKVSHMALAEFLAEHPRLEDSVAFVSGRCKRGVHPPAALAFLHYEMGQKHPEECREFFTRMLSQEGIPPGSVESRLNQWVHDNPAITSTQVGLVLYLAIWIKAWNFRLRGTAVTANHLTWRPGNNEAFPVIL